MRHVASSRSVPVQFWVVLLCLGVVLSIFYVWNHVPFFPISVVKVETNYDYAEPATIEEIISPDFPAGFWTVDIRTIRAKLQALSWVQSVSIEKIWPKTLKIRLIEKKAIARWGVQGVVSAEGHIFYLSHMLPKTEILLHVLPRLWGPQEDAPLVVHMYDTIAKKLAPYHLTVQSVHLSGSGAWNVVLSDGTELLLGSTQPLNRLDRFLRLQNTLFVNHVAKRVDLRYEHGLAITWAPDENQLMVKED